MCGRYTLLSTEDLQEMIKIIDTIEKKYGEGVIAIGEVFPTDSAPVIVGQNGTLVPQAMTWGFPQFKGSGVIINARAETAAEKPTFRKALEQRRCAVPATGFYEWKAVEGKKKKDKYLFTLPGGDMLYLAGLYNENNQYVIVTTDANEAVQPYHHRMPVVLTEDELEAWICDYPTALSLLRRVPPNLNAVLVDKD